MPFVLRRQGVPVDRIADVVAIATIPSIWFFLYAPVVDVGLRRRTWIMMASAATAILSATGVLVSAGSLTITSALLFTGSAIAGLLSSANGSLLTLLSPEVRGRAGGWYNAGNLGGGAIGGGVAIWLAGVASTRLLALGVALMISLPALAAALIYEPARTRVPFGPKLAAMARDLGHAAKSRRTLAGLIFILSPVGSAAIANLISGVGPDYRASSNEVLLVTGIVGGLLCALGSLVGGFVCDRIHAMQAYALSGGLCAAFAVYLAIGKLNGVTYGIGYSGYSIAAGFAYAAFTALVLDVLGKRQHAAGTAYSVLVAGGNLPIVYMTWLDGVGYKYKGAFGLAGVDALANGIGGVLLLIFAVSLGRKWMRPESPVEAPAEARETR